jgi:RHS repeat-associated protein
MAGGDRVTTPRETPGQDTASGGSEPFLPAPALPKGGGAIRGIGEKLTVNPARGTAAYEVPVFTSPGRSGFGPTCALRYDSGGGNSPFGMGWNLDVPTISRKTEKGLPRYTDEDTFVLAGAEDLVRSSVTAPYPATLDGVPCLVERFRPRVETAFTKIERCMPVGGGPAVWRTVSRTNVTSLYRTTVADPADPSRVFRWLLDEVRDDRGNVTRYEYRAEDLSGVDSAAAWERHRLGSVPAQRYLHRIRYGNQTPGHDDARFIVEFEYDGAVRPDAFSTYRPGFEVRTWRRCRRILMYHDFPADELGPGPLPRLVRSTDLGYDEDPAGVHLTSVTQTGYRWDAGTNAYTSNSLPKLEFAYTRSGPEDRVRVADPDTVANLPSGVDDSTYRWVDLDGDGLSGALTRQGGTWFYKRNLGGGRLGAREEIPLQPSVSGDGEALSIVDVGGDGSRALVRHGRLNGYQERAGDGWGPFTPFDSVSTVDWASPVLHQVDLDGDGLADVLLADGRELRWHPSLGRAGYGPQQRTTTTAELVHSGQCEAVLLADMSGDGLSDLVRVRNGEVCYWPNLGYGRFGAMVTMGGAPVFDHPDAFDPARVRLADLDGSGPTDVLYLGRGTVTCWINRSGNAFGPGRTLNAAPDTDRLDHIQVTDLLGSGTSCLVWSSPKPADGGTPLRYVDLSRAVSDWLPADDPGRAGHKANLLCQIRTNLGGQTRLVYAPSTRFSLADRAAGTPWRTRLPFPVQVVTRVEVTDEVAKTRIVNGYRYRHGYYDGPEREFRGFGMVEQTDAETFPPRPGELTELHRPPVRTRSWFHVGAALDVRGEWYGGDPQAIGLGDHELPDGVDATEWRESFRALVGQPLRTETYADDGVSAHPYLVAEHRYRVEVVESGGRHGVFRSHPLESVTHHYERDPADPRVGHEVTIEVDAYNAVRQSATIGYPRRVPAYPEQARMLATWTVHDVVHTDTPAVYRIAAPVEERVYEVTGVSTVDDLRTAVYTEIPYEQAPTPGTPQKRLVERQRTEYWNDTLTAALPLGQAGARALVRRTLRMAFTPGLLTAVYGNRVTPAMLTEGGYELADGVHWAPSGVHHHDPAAFYLPRRLVSPFGNESTVDYDAYALLPKESHASGTAPLDVLVTRVAHDYRVLAARELTDPNGNRTRAAFDELGRVVATWAQGSEGGADGDPDDLPGTLIEYHLDTVPVSAATAIRERHGSATGPWQRSRAYSDGSGRVVLTKVQAAPGMAWTLDGDGRPSQVDTGTAVRWIGSGRTVFDNKSKPVKKYEPYFSVTDGYEDEPALVKQGVTPILYYDPLGRLVRTELPDGSLTRVVVDPWRTQTWDGVDTVAESGWYTDRGSPSPALPEPGPADPDQRAAWLAAQLAGTPALSHVDSLGRTVRAVADGGAIGPLETRTELDIEGNERAVTDPRGIVVRRQDFDVAGRVVHTSSPEAGERWTLPDVDGTSVYAWDSRGHAFRYMYDPLRRPLARMLGDQVTDLHVYGEGSPFAVDRNMLGRAYLVFDGAGMNSVSRYDFKGNVLSSRRQLAVTFTATPDWAALAGQPVSTVEGAATGLGLVETEVFPTATTYDALNRPVLQVLPDGTVTTPTYDEGGRLSTVSVRLPGQIADTMFVKSLTYNARGDRLSIRYGNDVTTSYAYDPYTFRLTGLVTTRTGQRLQDLGYTYDPVGNITEIRDGALQTVFFAGALVAPVTRYRYDALYRITQATGREHASLGNPPDNHEPTFAPLPHPNDPNALRTYTELYAYDASGNLTTTTHQAGPSGSWTRTTGIDATSNRLVAPYQHDAHGNLTGMPHLPGALTWDHADRLSTVDLGGGGRAYYTYDAAGQRVRKVLVRGGGLVEERIYLPGYEEYRRRQNGNQTFRRTTVHVMDDVRRIALIETAEATRVRYQLGNHLGSCCLELSDAAEVVSYEEYHPYGTTSLWLGASTVEASDRRYRYTGKEKDEETALYYHGARYYVCWLARWTAPDPVGLKDGTNVYAYVRGNPVRLHDPGGTQGTDPHPPTGTPNPASGQTTVTGTYTSVPGAPHPADQGNPPDPNDPTVVRTDPPAWSNLQGASMFGSVSQSNNVLTLNSPYFGGRRYRYWDFEFNVVGSGVFPAGRSTVAPAGGLLFQPSARFALPEPFSSFAVGGFANFGPTFGPSGSAGALGAGGTIQGTTDPNRLFSFGFWGQGGAGFTPGQAATGTGLVNLIFQFRIGQNHQLVFNPLGGGGSGGNLFNQTPIGGFGTVGGVVGWTINNRLLFEGGYQYTQGQQRDGGSDREHRVMLGGGYTAPVSINGPDAPPLMLGGNVNFFVGLPGGATAPMTDVPGFGFLITVTGTFRLPIGHTPYVREHTGN